MKKKFTIILALLMLFMSVPLHAQTTSGTLRVGLKYGTVTGNPEEVESDRGFELVLIDGDDVSVIHDLSDFTVLQAQKDDDYHIQVGPVFGSSQDMLEALDSLSSKGRGLYPAFDKGWRIYYGSYSTAAKAQSDVSIAEGQFGQSAAVAPITPDYIRVESGNGLVFAFASSYGDFALRPIGSGLSQPVFEYADKLYRGSVGFKRYPDSALTVINYIGMDEYLYGVLPKEMSGDWPVEALKAQAVAARNFAVSSLGKHENHGFDVCATTDCQVYGGYSVEKPRSNQAVDETSGKLLKYNGQIVQAYYHSNSGGHTENIENIWSGSLPYIIGVEDPYSVGAPNSTWEISFTKKEIESILSSKGFDIGQLKDVRIEDVSENGRVQSLVFEGTQGKAEFKKEKARALFGYTTLKSMWFELGNKPMVTVVSRSAYSRADLSTARYMTSAGVEASSGSTYVVTDGIKTSALSFGGDRIVFRGRGYGHGLGMSQWGAKAMAEQGFTYEEILTHYYRNTVVE